MNVTIPYSVVFLLALVTLSSSSQDEPEPDKPLCPPGCQCTAGPKLHSRHHWHRLLAQYRMHRAAYAREGAGPRYQPYKEAWLPVGREMTCMGLTSMPSDVPNDVQKITFYGSANDLGPQNGAAGGHPVTQNTQSDGRWTDRELEGEGFEPEAGYQQLTSVAKYNLLGPADMKELRIVANRIKMLHSGEFDTLGSLVRLIFTQNRLQLISVRAFQGLDKLQLLDLSKNHVESIPRSSFMPLYALKKLILAENRLKEFHPNTLSPLGKLEYLDLSHNHLTEIEDATFYDNRHLTYISLANNNLKVIERGWFETLANLKTLDLRGNRVGYIADGTFEKLMNLNSLMLEKNELQRISMDTFSGLAQLQTLRLSDNNIEELEGKAFAQLSKLNELYLDNNKISEVTNYTFKGLHHVQTLSLTRNQLTNVEHSHVEPLKKLHKLDLSHNKLTHIKTRNFFGLRSLKDIRLDHNDIKVIDDEAFMVDLHLAFSRLTWIYLNANNLLSVTLNMFAGAPYVRFLNLGHNQIDRVEARAFSSVPRLHTLIMEHNEMKSVGGGLFKNNRFLRHLELSHNKILDLDRNAFLGLVYLEDATLQNNVIESLSPWTLKTTPNLRSLNLQRNVLRSFDLGTLENVPRLKSLDLSNNQLENIQVAMQRHRNLFYLALNMNNLQTLDENVTLSMAPHGSLHLYDNPWRCDCDLAWVRNVTAGGEVMISSDHELTCGTPDRLQGVTMMSLSPSEFCGSYDGTTPYQPKYRGETVPGEWRWWEKLTPFPKLEPETEAYHRHNHIDVTPSTTRRPYWLATSTRRPEHETSTGRPGYETSTGRSAYPGSVTTSPSSPMTEADGGDFSFSGEGEEEEAKKEEEVYQEEFINSGEFYVTKPVFDRPRVEDFIHVQAPDVDEAQNHLETTHEEEETTPKREETTHAEEETTHEGQETSHAVEETTEVALTTPTPTELSNGLFGFWGWPADAPYGGNRLECSFHPTTLSANTRDSVKKHKRETESFLARIYNGEEEFICLGVLLSSEWILLPSACIKDNPTALIMQFGPTSHKLFTPIKKIHHSENSDLSLIKINLMPITTFPCLLLEHGVEQARKQRVKGVIATTEHNAPRTKLRSFPIKLEKGCYVPDRLCFEANADRFSPKKFRSHNQPIFVKVGADKWALIGFSKQQAVVQSAGEVIVDPILNLQKWIGEIVA